MLMVNAYPGEQSDLWCAPGGGVERGNSLRDNLMREVFEETGLTIAVEGPCLINEFHDPKVGFHQVEIFFRCRLVAGALRDDWRDPEQVVSKRRWVSREEMDGLRFKPDSLADVAFDLSDLRYDDLELIVP